MEVFKYYLMKKTSPQNIFCWYFEYWRYFGQMWNAALFEINGNHSVPCGYAMLSISYSNYYMTFAHTKLRVEGIGYVATW